MILRVKKMSNKYLFGATRFIAVAFILSVFATHAVAASDESDVRSVVEQTFGQLRSGDYGALYDVLPSTSQKKISRERFASALERTRGMYELDRLEIGAVHVAGDLAVVDSTIYGRARAPFEGEGKLVLRGYLQREGGRWRVTLAERNAASSLLAANPTFARRYPPTQPRLYVKRDGKWQDLRTLMKDARQKRK